MRPEDAIGLMSDIRKRSDEQARQRLVEIALEHAVQFGDLRDRERDLYRCAVRARAGVRDPSKGSWCAAGLTAAMEDAGLLVPAPGTPARRGAIALLDWVQDLKHSSLVADLRLQDAQPGDIIAWLLHPPPDPAGWRRGHVAVIVATDSESITTVGWNEGPSPGRVMMRRLWRKSKRWVQGMTAYWEEERRPSTTVLWRRPGGLYGIARPVAV